MLDLAAPRYPTLFSALAHLERPWVKRMKANTITVEAAATIPRHARRRTEIVAIIPRSDLFHCDHARADLVVRSGDLAAAAALLLRDGFTDSFGTFAYLPPPRAGDDAIALLRKAMEGYV